MYIEAQIVFKSYAPLKLEKGMLFISQEKDSQLIQLDFIPQDEQEYLRINGYPVEPYIIETGNPNISNDEFIYAHPHQIGWFDEGEHSDELYDIELKNINKIISEYDGWVYIETDGYGIPILYEDKVTLSYANEDDYEIDEDADDDDDYYNNDDI